MIQSIVITLLPVLFLSLLIGSGIVFRQGNIDMDGKAPINRVLFVTSKYSIVLLWAVMVMQAWGFRLSFLAVPDILRTTAIGFWAIGFLLLFAGRFGLGSSFRIGSSKESTELRRDGLFRFSRNPMYLGVYCTILAAVLYTLNPLVLLIGAYVVAVHHRIILAEEAQLRIVFGEQYAEYAGQVRRYL